MDPGGAGRNSATLFGHYEFLSRLAVGGMAEIFLAREQGGRADEFLVVKRLLPHISQHPELVQMFLDEARIAATLDHENIVKIQNVGAVRDQYFLSMEHLRGLDLAKVCGRLWRRRRSVPLELAIYLVRSVLRALEYAHTCIGTDGKPLKIVHRDVSPHNIFVTFDGGVKLLDFGVAKAANALHHTKTGALVGKIGYMSPEQCRVGSVDKRSDLFNLGIVLFELTVGGRLYSAKKLGDFEVLRRTCEEPPPRPSQLRPGYPLALEEVVLKALAKKVGDRFQGAAEFEEALLGASGDLDAEQSPELMAAFLASEFAEEVDKTNRKLERLTSMRVVGDELISWDALEVLVLEKTPPEWARSARGRETAPPPLAPPARAPAPAPPPERGDATRPIRRPRSSTRPVEWRKRPTPTRPPLPLSRAALVNEPRLPTRALAILGGLGVAAVLVTLLLLLL